jgi:hypothetical protein
MFLDLRSEFLLIPWNLKSDDMVGRAISLTKSAVVNLFDSQFKLRIKLPGHAQV